MSNPRGTVYPNAPLSLVTIEVRFGYQPKFNQRAARDEFANTVSDRFPLLTEEIAPPPPGQSADSEGRAQIRATSEDRQISVSLSSQSLDLVMSGEAYRGFDDLAPRLGEVFEACLSVARDTRLQRIGVRYLNELRLPVRDGTEGWRRWVNDAVLGGALALPGATGLFTQVAFEPADDRGVLARYGQLTGESVISDDIPLRLPTRASGEYFIVDVDSWWQGDDPVIFEPGLFGSLVRDLHEPIETFFEWAITDEARDTFRQER